MHSLNKLSLSVLLCAAALSVSPIAQAQEQSISIQNEEVKKVANGIQLTIEGVRNGKGEILVFVFDDEAAYEAYDYMKAVDYAIIPAKKGSVSHNFANLNAGPYAIGFFHDENSDEDFNMTGGLPTEGFGTTGLDDPMVTLPFSDATVSPGKVTVKMHYFD